MVDNYLRYNELSEFMSQLALVALGNHSLALTTGGNTSLKTLDEYQSVIQSVWCVLCVCVCVCQ